MFPWASPLRRSPELRRRLALVLAAAEDLIIQANVEEAVLFLQATERQLGFEEALAIYFRVAGVPGRIRHAVAIHTLSRLGKGSIEELLVDTPPEGASGIRALARRLRGRRRESLRQEVEAVSARARAQVRTSYLDGANNAVEMLRDVVSPAEAVQYYIDALQIGQDWADFVLHEVAGKEWAESKMMAEPTAPPAPGAIDHAEGRLETPDADA